MDRDESLISELEKEVFRQYDNVGARILFGPLLEYAGIMGLISAVYIDQPLFSVPSLLAYQGGRILTHLGLFEGSKRHLQLIEAKVDRLYEEK